MEGDVASFGVSRKRRLNVAKKFFFGYNHVSDVFANEEEGKYVTFFFSDLS